MGHGDAAGSVVWRASWLRVPLAALPLGLTFLLLQTVAVPSAVKLIVLGVLGIALARPVAGLLILAALAPLGHLVAILVGVPQLRFTDAVVVAFIGGWLLRGLPDRRGPDLAAPLLAWLFAVALAAPIVSEIWRLRPSIAETARGAGDLARMIYLPADGYAFVYQITLVEWLALTAATVMLFRQRPKLAVTLPAVLAGSAAIAAAVTVGAGTVFHGYQLTSPATDRTAIAGYFLSMFCLAIGMMLRTTRRRRIPWAASSAILAIGLASAIVRQDSPDGFLAIRNDPGLVEMGLLVAWAGVGLERTVRALRLERRDPRLLGASVGPIVLVVLLLGSRPPLVSEVAVPLWIQFGLMMALAGSTVLNAAPGAQERAG